MEAMGHETAGESDEERRARELRIIEEQQEIEQRYLRVYTDYTLTILEPVIACDLENQREWNIALQHVHGQDNCQRVVWGHVLNKPSRVLVIFSTFQKCGANDRATDHH